jgi:hypothetical protein
MPENRPRCVNLDQNSGANSDIWSHGKDLFKNNFGLLLKIYTIAEWRLFS